MILPGATLGMLGGGQLGRLFILAAHDLGYRVVVLDPDPDSPAGRVADEHLHASYNDPWALERMAQDCAAVTTEFENIPAETLERLAEVVPVFPAADAVRTAQDRIREKTFIREAGLPTAPFAVVRSVDDLDAAMAAVGVPAILKRAALGYDGKGQVRIGAAEELGPAFAALGEVPCVLERRVELEREVSVVLARGGQGEALCFPLAENEHRGGILDVSIVPARVSERIASQARAMALSLAERLDYRGVMAVEFFLTRDGDLLVNEIAPRPHNSGHYTIDACATSQFEQQLRALCGLPLGDVRLLSPVVMVNLLGDLWAEREPHWDRIFSADGAQLHLYGKREPRPGRKMGHFCVLDCDADRALQRARDTFAAL
jgi:5-(carboxyamino)imidazole ribonucleotide synthase